MKLIPKILAGVKTGQNIIFRGHADAAWELKPSIGRHYNGDWSKVAERERRALAEFKIRAVPFIQQRPQSDIEWLALMQHYGCATRLIDFTTNPLIALFFASDPSHRKSGELIVSSYKRSQNSVTDSELFNQEQSFVYQPPHITERIIGQSGCFVYCHQPAQKLQTSQATQHRVSNREKPLVRKELAALGITYSSIFPGLDGICRDLNDTLVNDLALEALFSEL